MASVPKTRTGARTFLNLLKKACDLSHTPGFTRGMETILGPDNAGAVLTLWVPLCHAVEIIIAADDWFNQVDYAAEMSGDEDRAEVI